MKIPQIKDRQGGFTLIELIVVMVILGILAAFAIPRFANLTSEARAATVNGAKASVESAVTIVRSKWLASGGGAGNVEIDGVVGGVTHNNGYPTANAGGICAAVRFNDKIVCEVAGDGELYIGYRAAPTDDIDDTTCRVSYALNADPATDVNIGDSVDDGDCG